MRHSSRGWRRKSSSVSIHAPWEGCDSGWSCCSSNAYGFNSRTLGRVRQAQLPAPRLRAWFQFTHPGKGATATKRAERDISQRVSIHAPWEGCDKYLSRSKAAVQGVSIHAPWEGCDIEQTMSNFHHSRFNSRTLGRVRLISPRWSLLPSPSFNSRTLGRVRHPH